VAVYLSAALQINAITWEQELTSEKEARSLTERELGMLIKEKEVRTLISPLSHQIIYAMDSRDLQLLRNNVADLTGSV